MHALSAHGSERVQLFQISKTLFSLIYSSSRFVSSVMRIRSPSIDGERIVITKETRREDEGIPADERTMKLLQEIANSIHPSIRMTIDYPSKYVDGKVPMLDLKILSKMWREY